MKVTFVYPDQVEVDPTWSGHFYYGIGTLSSYLKRADVETSLIHIIDARYTEAEFEAALLREKPDLIAFSCTTFGFTLAKRYVKVAKRVMPAVPTICGGIHPTFAPGESILEDGLDMVCLGEGEEAMLDLCNRLRDGEDYLDIPNIWVKRNGTVHENDVRPVNQDLNSYPFPDRELFDYPSLHHEQQGWGTFMMTRGCAFGCTYCANRSLMHLYRGQNYVRFRSVDNLIAEILEVIERYPFIKSIHFDDDLPFIKADFTDEFCRKYKEKVGLPFRFNLRPNVTFEAELLKLKDAGCTEAKIGLESGNEHIMNDILGRSLNVKQVEEAFHTANRVGIKTVSFNMVGLPDETPSAVLDTIKLNARARSTKMQVSIFYPFQGTPLWDLCQERGYLPEEVPVDFFTGALLPLPTITKSQIEFFHHRFHQLVKVYRLVYGFGGGADSPLMKVLDKSLTFEPTRKVWEFTFATLLPSYRYVRDAIRGVTRKPVPQDPEEQYLAM